MITKLKTSFALKESYKPKYYILDAKNQTLGRICTLASKLLQGKENAFYTPGVDLGNFLVIVNADYIKISGKKKLQKLYYRHSQRPGSLKKQNFLTLQKRFSYRILEKAIWGMLPKGCLGRIYYRRLFIYSDEFLNLRKHNINSINDVIFFSIEPFSLNK